MFRTTEIVRVMGVTARMLDRWVSEGVVNPSLQNATSSGVDRIFSLQDMLAIAVVAELRKLGVSLDGVRPAVSHLSTLAFHEDGEAPGDYLACFSKGEVLVLKLAEVPGAIKTRRGQNVILLDLATIFENVQGASMEVSLARTPKPPRKRTTKKTHRRSRRE